MPVSQRKVRQQLCEIGRRIWLKGFCAGTDGNYSCRIGENRILCTPSGMGKGFLKPDDLCTVDMDGHQIAGKRKRTSEIRLHLAVYRNRADVGAVIHTHAPHATAFALAGVELPRGIYPEAEVSLGAVRTAKYVTPGDQRLADSIVPFIKDSNAVLLARHGTITFAEDLEQAYCRLEMLEAYARIVLLARQLGSLKPLSRQEMKELEDARKGSSQRRVHHGRSVSP